jgi:hypothetical protein
MTTTTNDITDDIGMLKSKILDLIAEYENKHNMEIHIGGYKYDHIKRTKDFDLIVFKKNV